MTAGAERLVLEIGAMRADFAAIEPHLRESKLRVMLLEKKVAHLGAEVVRQQSRLDGHRVRIAHRSGLQRATSSD